MKPTNKISILLLAISFFSAVKAANHLQHLSTDKARYSPGENVQFTLQLTENADGGFIQVSVFHLSQIIAQHSVSVESNPVTWSWQPPKTDYSGYLAEIILRTENAAVDTAWIAIDVSSDWSKFPRYGFLSKYPYLSTSQIKNTIAELNRYHINGLQFYDWHYKHHLPLKGTPENPAEFWNDIANRTNYYPTVAGYVNAAHERNMVTMSYNLLFGAYRDAVKDGVPTEWRLFRDANHSQPDFHDLPSSWASDIYLMDASNPYWINHIIEKTSDAFQVFSFDGWHIDQLGDRGRLYNYAGEEILLPDTFAPFIHKVKESLGGSVVMNAVNQYGGGQIAASPVDFLYTEVWSPNDSYSSLVSIITRNNAWSNGQLPTVLAAYVNKAQSSQPGVFNPPAVLLTDAVIFAAGGAHLELGEHMLANEYFPNDNLRMPSELQEKLVAYYDFLVAYQNLLRDGGEFTGDYLQSNGDIKFRNIARRGSVWSFVKQFENRQVFHLINFVNAISMDWRDDTGAQPEPESLENLDVSFAASKEIKSLWLASPDRNGGMPEALTFEKRGESIHFTIPALYYWDMIVAEYESPSRIEKQSTLPNHAKLKVSPNPFNPSTHIYFNLTKPSAVKLDIYNTLGVRVHTLVDQPLAAGEHAFRWHPSSTLAGGVYFVVFRKENRNVQTHKVIYIK